MPTDLEQSILKTLCWFAVFDRPITGFEIWKWLIEPARSYDLSEVFHVLGASVWVKGRVIQEAGFYLLADVSISDGEQRIRTRTRNYLDATKKFQRLRRVTAYFKFLQSIRLVAAVNSISWWNTSQTSDIDLFVVTKPQSIWSSRFWMVVPFIVFGKRPGASHHDPFCFSFFATASHLEMDRLRLREGDHYFAFWLKSFVPMFDRDGVMHVLEETNRWADQILPNARTRSVHPLHRSKDVPPIMIHTGWFESLYRSVSQKRFPLTIRGLANKDSRVVITDDMLKFHETDRRAEFEERYQKNLLGHGVIS